MPRRARAGERFTRCIGCNQGCIGHYHAGVPIACTINPWTGHERVLGRPDRAGAPGTVVVVGAGPAGAAAAACARAAGHRVVVFERAEGPGGQMRLGVPAPGKREIATGLIATLEAWLEGCETRYRTAADAELVLAERPDRVIDATGAVAYEPAIGGEGPAVVQAFDVLAGAATGRQVFVHDWGGDWTGLDVAELLAERGCAVRLATSAAAFGDAIHQYQRNLYLERLDRAGVDLVHHVRVTGLRAGGLELRNVFSDREMSVDGVDTLVVSAGRSSSNELYERLTREGADVLRAGDVLSPRSFEEAIREGTDAGLRPLARAAAA
jgi:NADPH-dependent 2,4-dienoyl-CoA reductase/sulfur reductase-like enzyme